MGMIHRPIGQYAVVGDLILAYNAASSGSLLPWVLEGVSTALERPGTHPPDSHPAPAGATVCLTIYTAGGQRPVAACHRLLGADLTYDEALGVHFWSSGLGWWVLLPTVQAVAAFRGLLQLWQIVEKGWQALGPAGPAGPPSAVHESAKDPQLLHGLQPSGQPRRPRQWQGGHQERQQGQQRREQQGQLGGWARPVCHSAPPVLPTVVPPEQPARLPCSRSAPPCLPTPSPKAAGGGSDAHRAGGGAQQLGGIPGQGGDRALLEWVDRCLSQPQLAAQAGLGMAPLDSQQQGRRPGTEERQQPQQRRQQQPGTPSQPGAGATWAPPRGPNAECGSGDLGGPGPALQLGLPWWEPTGPNSPWQQQHGREQLELQQLLLQEGSSARSWPLPCQQQAPMDAEDDGQQQQQQLGALLPPQALSSVFLQHQQWQQQPAVAPAHLAAKDMQQPQQPATTTAVQSIGDTLAKRGRLHHKQQQQHGRQGRRGHSAAATAPPRSLRGNAAAAAVTAGKVLAWRPPEPATNGPKAGSRHSSCSTSTAAAGVGASSHQVPSLTQPQHPEPLALPPDQPRVVVKIAPPPWQLRVAPAPTVSTAGGRPAATLPDPTSAE